MNDKFRRLALLFWLGGPAVLGVLAAVVCGACGYRINTTSSVPIGLYRHVSNPAAPYIAFCPTPAQGRLANERSYRYRSIACADGFAPLLKPIRARAGDTITVSAAGIFVNGVLLRNSAAKKLDGMGRRLPVIPPGTYSVAPNTVWVISSYNPQSFDSRYFGPVSLSRIISYAKPVWTF